ncbi:MAG: GIY-YIG nuclease family protein, partial [Actinomycetota bacterium]|nr:GIY-YIG nuclease family protein [Actinomycetota bacterium]
DTKWNLYLLQHEHSGRTYLGITTDMERRLRQHNGLLSGGSKYTRAFRGTASVASGEEHFSPWKEALVVKGLSRSRAMALEAQIKIESKKKGNSSNGARESHTTRASQRAQLVLSRITDCERGRTYVKTSLE